MKYWRAGAFVLLCYATLSITQILTNVLLVNATMSLPLYGLVKALLYLLLGSAFCYLFLRMFSISIEDCDIFPVKIHRFWIFFSCVFDIILLFVYWCNAKYLGKVNFTMDVLGYENYLLVYSLAYYAISSVII